MQPMFTRKPSMLFISRCFFFLIVVVVVVFLSFWLCWVMVALGRLSRVVMSGSYSLLQCTDFSLRWLLLLLSTSFSSCGTWAQQLWHVGSAVVKHRLSRSVTCEIFSVQIKDWTSVPWFNWQVNSSPLHHQGSPGSLFSPVIFSMD